MESEKQPETNSDPSHYPVWKYLWRIVLGELVLLSLELYFFIRSHIFNPIVLQNLDQIIIFFIWCLFGFLFLNLLIAMFVISLPAWQERKSLKTAILALGSCLLAYLPFFLALLAFLTIFIIGQLIPSSMADHSSAPSNTSTSFNWPLAIFILQFMLLVLSMILSGIGLVWGLADDRKGNLLNIRAGVAAKFSRDALVLSVLLMIPTCCLVGFFSGFFRA
jgi:hypothetical protein